MYRDVGTAIEHRLVWRFVLQVAGEPGTWSGAVDATTGKVVSLFDDTMDVWSTEEFNLLKDLSVITRWSQPEELIQALAA